jgi:hypothetical protein
MSLKVLPMSGIRTLLSRGGEPTRRTRRLIVAATVIAIPLGVWFPMLAIRRLEWPIGLELLVFLVVLLAFAVPMLILQEFRRNILGRDDLDRRERQRRYEAYEVSYRVLQWGLILVIPGTFLIRGQLAAFLGDDAFLVYWPVVWYVIFLPYLALAWREPDARAGRSTSRRARGSTTRQPVPSEVRSRSK